MITESEKRTIRKISKRYAVKRVLLFGSSLVSGGESRDIDLAMEGISPADFFRYYGDLMIGLSKPVDVIDLAKASKFTSMIKREGMPLCGNRQIGFLTVPSGRSKIRVIPAQQTGPVTFVVKKQLGCGRKSAPCASW